VTSRMENEIEHLKIGTRRAREGWLSILLGIVLDLEKKSLVDSSLR
jgi:hypothetical protein